MHRYESRTRAGSRITQTEGQQRLNPRRPAALPAAKRVEPKLVSTLRSASSGALQIAQVAQVLLNHGFLRGGHAGFDCFGG
jgi:hypothetical protein